MDFIHIEDIPYYGDGAVEDGVGAAVDILGVGAVQDIRYGDGVMDIHGGKRKIN